MYQVGGIRIEHTVPTVDRVKIDLNPERGEILAASSSKLSGGAPCFTWQEQQEKCKQESG